MFSAPSVLEESMLLYIGRRLLYMDRHLLYMGRRLLYMGRHLLYMDRHLLYMGRHLLYMGRHLLYMDRHLLYMGRRFLMCICHYIYIFIALIWTELLSDLGHRLKHKKNFDLYLLSMSLSPLIINTQES